MIKTVNYDNHPCFNIKAKHKYSRVHLPIAPACNVQCNFCNRKYDCVNESRPGVTSTILQPEQAVSYVKTVSEKLENLSVIGIAGPGDPMADPMKTIKTFQLLRASFPEKIFCLSTNGLNLFPYLDELANLDVSHVTITINAVDPDITKKIYSWFKYEDVMYNGIQGAELLLNKQLSCIPALKERGIIVKINTVVIPGVNDHHISVIAEKVRELGADIMNCIPLIPVEDTVFENLKEPTHKQMVRLRTRIKENIPVMTHCARCRADAVGLLGQDLEDTASILQQHINNKGTEPVLSIDRPYIAVASSDGMLVDQHLGKTKYLYIYQQTVKGFKYVEKRKTPAIGIGDFRWIRMAGMLKDCRALLVYEAGYNPMNILKDSGINIVKMKGLIDEGLNSIYNKNQLTMVNI